MIYNLLYKTLVIGVLFIFVGFAVFPCFSVVSESVNEEAINSPGNIENLDETTVTFYAFDRTGMEECEVGLSCDVADYISDRFEDLVNNISVDPGSVESKLLKVDFVDLLDSYGLVPVGVSKEYVVSLLSPWWFGLFVRVNPFVRFDGSSVRDGFLPFGSVGSAFLCGVGGVGAGFMFLPIMFPRPRLVASWSSFFGGYSYAANLFTGRGFVAEGVQFGSALGFMGIGLSYVYPGYPAIFGFYGYSLFTRVNAEDIETYPPNREPVISEENPASGVWDVPVSLSELSFHINDGDGDRMS